MRKDRLNAILRKAGKRDVDSYDPRELEALLKGGVLYGNKGYWTDGQDRGCFAIYPRGLDITNSDRPAYWHNGGAKVVKARWLEVRGSFLTKDLLRNVRYRVLIKLKMATSSSTMRGQPVILKLSLPDGIYQEGQANLPGSHESWEELEFGQFTMTEEKVGEMEFAMVQLFGRWRNGLMIERVTIGAV